MKIFSQFILVAILILSGCHAKPEPMQQEQIEMTNGQSVATVVQKMSDELGMEMPADVDKDTLKDLFFIDEESVQDYAGKLSMKSTKMDQFIAIKTKPEKHQIVVNKLKQRLSDVQVSFAEYQEDENRLQGQIVENGNYVFLIIINESSRTIDSQMQKMLDIVRDAFSIST